MITRKSFFVHFTFLYSSHEATCDNSLALTEIFSSKNLAFYQRSFVCVAWVNLVFNAQNPYSQTTLPKYIYYFFAPFCRRKNLDAMDNKFCSSNISTYTFILEKMLICLYVIFPICKASLSKYVFILPWRKLKWLLLD